jgi:hypothetical protein
MDTVQRYWERIESWFRTRAISLWDPSSSEPASEEEIAQAQAIMESICY